MYEWRLNNIVLCHVWMTILLCINNIILSHVWMTILLCINNIILVIYEWQ